MTSSCGEVGAVPGTYRLMDLFCLREVLNQIMKCSCQVRIVKKFSIFRTFGDVVLVVLSDFSYLPYTFKQVSSTEN
jgi:hypothetical protein